MFFCGFHRGLVVMILLYIVINPTGIACTFDVYELLVGVFEIDIVRILAVTLESAWYRFWGRHTDPPRRIPELPSA